MIPTVTFQNNYIRFYINLINPGKGKHTTHLLKCVLLSSEILSDISLHIFSDIFFDILSDISFAIFSDISSDILSDISFDILSNISFDVLSNRYIF